MIDIKNILYEDGVKEVFKFIVPTGNYQGEYIINKPDGWDESDSIVDIDEDLFQVKNFIIGENSKLTFTQYSDGIAYDLLENVYQEQKGDGRVVFKWIAIKNGIEHDLLQDNFEVNMNKYSNTLDRSMFKTEVEIIKSEAQNKLFNREDTTIDLFATKDLDENEINPVETFDIGYKKGDKKLSNFYTYDLNQNKVSAIYRYENFFSFQRSEGYEFGDNTNEYAGNKSFFNYDQGPFVSTNISLKKIEIEITNMLVKFKLAPDVSLYAVISSGGSEVRIKLKESVKKTINGETFSEISIENEKFQLPAPNETLLPGQSLYFKFISPTEFVYEVFKETTSIEITTNLESPLVKTKGVRIIDAIKQVVKNYTASNLGVISSYIGVGGIYYDTSISTGVYLRGLPTLYTVGQKINTSFKSLITDGLSKLLALGYDILGNNVIIEDLGYFFKDVQSHDLTSKIYLHDDFKIDNDKDVTFNSLVFGSKKYSTKVKDDIRNFITSSELSTPIKSMKNKFDKQTDLIIDEYKIQELIEDNSSSTNDNDDDIVLIDMINSNNYWDYGIFDNCIHSVKNGHLAITCNSIPFDTTLMSVGSEVQIVEGINQGPHQILEINANELILNKTTSIQEGMADTPFRYLIPSLIKNRVITDSFTQWNFVRNPETSTNARHNPKYHMARWFPYFGSGLRKKLDSELIKVTKYKNNSKAQMKTNSLDLANELPGLITVGEDETLGKMRSYKHTLFSGDVISLTLSDVSFSEFIQVYENWRYGHLGNRNASRGYISVNTPKGLLDVYPFGDGSFSHSRSNNTLKINGKIKGRTAKSPTLLMTNQINRNTVHLKWDYDDQYVNPNIDIQFSIDGVNWTTLKQVSNVKEDTFSSDLLNNIISGTSVHFRVFVSTNEFNKFSNTITVVWKFNSFTITEVGKDIDSACGYSEMYLDITGTANLNIVYSYACSPSGGRLYVRNLVNHDDDVELVTPYGQPFYPKNVNRTISVNNETKRLYIQVFSSDRTVNGNYLNCSSGNNTIIVLGSVYITFTEQGDDLVRDFELGTEATKKYN
ncbi:hypothetical protein [Chryseobacterium sp. M5A1_1a]